MGSGSHTIKRLYRLVLDLVLPPQCVVCGRVETWLCPDCAQQLPLAARPTCPRCGDAWTGEGLCMRCRTTPLSVAPIRSVFLFEDAVREAIYALKYRGGRDVVVPLSQRMAEVWRRDGLSTDLLIPVPLYLDREKERGYNQAQLLARALAPQLGVPLEEVGLFRVRPTESQTRLGIVERWTNVKGAFACSDALDLSGVRVTLVDDVATTGATLNACAVALLARGASAVSAFTLAHAV